MATREEIGIAIDVIRTVNQMGETARSMANTLITNQNVKIQTVIDNTANRDKLINGLTALGVSVADLQTDKNAIVAVCQYVLDNISGIVKI